MQELILDGHSLTFSDVLAVAYDSDIKVHISESAKPQILKAANAVKAFVDDKKVVYGITTGFGAFKDHIISPENVNQLQHNILVSHAVGVGDKLDVPTTRAIMVIRANTLAQGHSGIRLETLERLINFLNLGIIPIIPEKGSLGASGDLAPLAHMALPLIGHGDVIFNGIQMPAEQALKQANLPPISLCAKEGLALTNGTTFMTAQGLLTCDTAEKIISTANIAAALSLEALNGTLTAFDPRIHKLRPHQGQTEIAQVMRALLEDSQLIRGKESLNVQDAYTLRCIPQVHGAILDALRYAKRIIETELNAVTDNPLIFFDDNDQPLILSGGNFHGEPLALALDFLKIAMTDLGNISERRIAKLVDETNNQYLLPAFLTLEGGLNSGFMLLQYTAAALASENKVLSHPSSADSLPSSGSVEDHVSMGANAALHACQVISNLQKIVAIELMCAAQAVDFRLMKYPGFKLGRGTGLAYNLVRQHIPFIKKDCLLYPHLNEIIDLVSSAKVFQAVSEVILKT